MSWRQLFCDQHHHHGIPTNELVSALVLNTMPKEPLSHRILAGSVGSIVTSLAVTPLEVVKVRMQQSSCVICAPPGCACTVRPDVGSVLRHIARTEGVGGLYAGLRPTLLMAVPNTVLYFTAYAELVDRLPREQSLAPLVAGSSARWLASTVTAPLEWWRTRQAASGATTELWQKVVQRDGWRVVFQGLAPTLWRDVPFSGIYWMGVETIRKQWPQGERSVEQQLGQALVNGSVSGIVAAALTTPLDNVKTRQQTTASTHRTTMAHLRHIVQTEGTQALWRGNVARMLKVAPSCAIMIASYEVGLRLLE